MRKNAEKMDLSSCNRLLQVPTGSGHMTRYPTHHMTCTLTLGGSLYPWHSLGEGSLASVQLPWNVMTIFGDGPVGYMQFTLVPFLCQSCVSGSRPVQALVKGLGLAAEGGTRVFCSPVLFVLFVR